MSTTAPAPAYVEEVSSGVQRRTVRNHLKMMRAQEAEAVELGDRLEVEARRILGKSSP